ncbi:protein containing DUF1007 [Candidatus Magnetomorum sp. HK-1]|nr:protein containing DUF1007 [Candidatus Magnetomorum sp. HK-1]
MNNANLTKMKRTILYLFFFAFYWDISIAFSHPHVFIENKLTFIFDENSLKGIKQEWQLDEFFSQSILSEINKDGDNQLNKKEIEAVRSFAFESLKDYQFFTHVKINGKKIEIKSAKNFSAEIKEGKLIYIFFIECPVNINKKDLNLIVAIFDNSYYSSITQNKKSLVFKNASKYHITHTFEKIHEWAYYNDMLIPEGIKLNIKKKK